MDTTETGADIDLTETTADPSQDVTDRANKAARREMAGLIWDIRHGHQTLGPKTLAGWTYTNREANAIIRAANRSHHTTIWLTGTITDNLTVRGSVTGNLYVSGSVTGDLTVRGSVTGDLNVVGSVTGEVTVWGSVTGDLYVDRSGSVGGNLNVSRSGSVTGDLNVSRSGSVTGDLNVSGSVGGGLDVWGSVGGLHVWRSGSVGGDLDVRRPGSVGRDLTVSGSVGGGLDVWGSVGGDLSVTGSIAGPEGVLARGVFEGRVVLTPSELMRLGSVRGARFADEVFVGDLVDISACDMGQSPDLDKLRLVGSDPFPKGTTGLANPPAGGRGVLVSGEMASIYRQLRTNLESRSNRPQAALFYRGEMNARREAARAQGRWFECGLLWLYRLLSGYGLRPVPAFGSFVVVAVGATLWFRTGEGLDLDVDAVAEDLAGFWDALLFTVRSMVGFFRPPQADLSTGQGFIQLGLRFLGPVLLAQAVFAVRERVAR